MAEGKAVAFRVGVSFTREQPAAKGGNWATKKVKKSYVAGNTYPIDAISERDLKWAKHKKHITVLFDRSDDGKAKAEAEAKAKAETEAEAKEEAK